MNKLRVTPIGTCRINTPLKLAEAKYPITLNTDGVYGFTHTSDEALQLLRYLQGEKQFRADAEPVIFRPDWKAADASPWRPSDLHIIEISSAKRVTSGDDSVQINYLYRHFADFFASPQRTVKFWSLIKRRARAELGEFLRDEPTYRMMTPTDRRLLTSLALKLQNFESIKRDMAEIVERLGRDSVLFMTHVNATTADDSTIPARERLIRWVRLAARQLDVGCFDPTEVMRGFGQERAMEQGGLDLAHFTSAFSDRVYAELHREHVSRLMDSKPDFIVQPDDIVRQQQFLADNIDAVIQLDDFFVGSRKLHAALLRMPDAVPLIQLRGKVLAKIGDFEGSIRDLWEYEASSNLPQDARVALLEALTHTGNCSEALRLAEELLGDEYENSVIYECAATAAEHLGRDETALIYWKQAFRYDGSNFTAALKGLALLSKLGPIDQFDVWRQEILDRGASNGNGAFEIGRWALEHGDEDLTVQAFGAFALKDIDGAEDLIRGALSGGMFGAVAKCLGFIASQEVALNAARRRYEEIAIEVSKISADLLIGGQMRLAYDLAKAANGICTDKLSTQTLRKVVGHYRKLVRMAFAQKEFEEVVAIAAEAGDVIFVSFDAALPLSIALSKLGRDDEALAIALKMHEIDPHDVLAMRWAGRIAAALGKYEVALPMYARLASSNDPKAEVYAEEQKRFFATADRRSIKQLRFLTLEGRFEEALNLAEILGRHAAGNEQVANELARLHRTMRVQLRQIETGEADDEDRERILKLLLRMQPDDEVFLRRTALEMMRQMRFDEAAELWDRLDTARPGIETNVRNLKRCRINAERQKKTGATRGIAAA